MHVIDVLIDTLFKSFTFHYSYFLWNLFHAVLDVCNVQAGVLIILLVARMTLTLRWIVMIVPCIWGRRLLRIHLLLLDHGFQHFHLITKMVSNFGFVSVDIFHLLTSIHSVIIAMFNMCVVTLGQQFYKLILLLLEFMQFILQLSFYHFYLPFLIIYQFNTWYFYDLSFSDFKRAATFSKWVHDWTVETWKSLHLKLRFCKNPSFIFLALHSFVISLLRFFHFISHCSSNFWRVLIKCCQHLSQHNNQWGWACDHG